MVSGVLPKPLLAGKLWYIRGNAMESKVIPQAGNACEKRTIHPPFPSAFSTRLFHPPDTQKNSFSFLTSMVLLLLNVL